MSCTANLILSQYRSYKTSRIYSIYPMQYLFRHGFQICFKFFFTSSSFFQQFFTSKQFKKISSLNATDSLHVFRFKTVVQKFFFNPTFYAIFLDQFLLNGNTIFCQWQQFFVNNLPTTSSRQLAVSTQATVCKLQVFRFNTLFPLSFVTSDSDNFVKENFFCFLGVDFYFFYYSRKLFTPFENYSLAQLLDR